MYNNMQVHKVDRNRECVRMNNFTAKEMQMIYFMELTNECNDDE